MAKRVGIEATRDSTAAASTAPLDSCMHHVRKGAQTGDQGSWGGGGGRNRQHGNLFWVLAVVASDAEQRAHHEGLAHQAGTRLARAPYV